MLPLDGGRRGFERLARLVRQVPCYWLKIGNDLDGIPTAIRGALLTPSASLATLLQSIDAVACCSHSVARALWECVPSLQQNIGTIHNALEVPLVEPTLLSFEPPRLLALGRLVPQKGFDVAIEVLALLLPHFPELRLTIAGDGPLFNDLKRQIEKKALTHSVTLIGWVSSTTFQPLSTNILPPLCRLKSANPLV